MRATADPADNPTPEPVPTVNVPVATVAHWAELAAFAVDATERERVDALLELAESVETILESVERAA